MIDSYIGANTKTINQYVIILKKKTNIICFDNFGITVKYDDINENMKFIKI